MNINSEEYCGIPGPTFIIYNGTNVNLYLHNKMNGESLNSIKNDKYINKIGFPDITNIHTHGIHIDPNIDNPLLIINPNTSHLYKYKFNYGLKFYIFYIINLYASKKNIK